MSKDNINPDHYKNSTSLECIEAMELAFGKTAVLDFCICNAWKYLWRWQNKNGLEDLYKAQWYCDKAAELDSYDLKRMTIDAMDSYIQDSIEKVHINPALFDEEGRPKNVDKKKMFDYLDGAADALNEVSKCQESQSQ